jgi:BRCA1-associated protein
MYFLDLFKLDALEPTTATFIPSSETTFGSTNLPEGIVHVFRDEPGTESNQIVTEADAITLGVLAVPSWMTPSDFLTFVAPAAEGMSHLRILR